VFFNQKMPTFEDITYSNSAKSSTTTLSNIRNNSLVTSVIDPVVSWKKPVLYWCLCLLSDYLVSSSSSYSDSSIPIQHTKTSEPRIVPVSSDQASLNVTFQKSISTRSHSRTISFNIQGQHNILTRLSDDQLLNILVEQAEIDEKEKPLYKVNRSVSGPLSFLKSSDDSSLIMSAHIERTIDHSSVAVASPRGLTWLSVWKAGRVGFGALALWTTCLWVKQLLVPSKRV